MKLLFRQIRVLAQKDLYLLFNPKSRFTTLWRAVFIPLIFAMYMSFVLKVYWPKEQYGIGSPTQVRSLADAFHLTTGGRDTFVMVNAVNPGGDIDNVIQLIAQPLTSTGKTIKITDNVIDMIQTCQSSLQGTTKCYGAVVFNSSPKEGPWGVWNYTIRSDASFGTNVDMSKTTNDVEIYQIPLQRTIDAAIAKINSTGDAVALASVDEYPFTSETQQAWKNGITVSIQKGIYGYIAIVWYIGFVGVMYQLVGLMAKEREFGMSDLVESMMPNVRRWEPQLARLVAHHIAFTIVYAPSWILMAIFFKIGLFPHGSIGILIIFFILAGLALTSCSIFGAAFFRKAQLSGITNVVLVLLLGIIAQIEVKKMSAATVAILGLLFTPMTFVFCLSSTSRFEANQIPINILHVAPGSTWNLAPGIFWIFFLVQIFAYPLLAVYTERWLYGTASKRARREVSWDDGEKTTPVKLTNFRKVYQQNFFLRFVASMLGHKSTPVVAMDDLSLSALQGQIMVLVGANGCGKTTVLNAIAGLSSITGGSISIDGSGGIGLCPQKNVLWNGLTVEQHAKIFYTLKTVNPADMIQDINKLINLCGLDEKRKSYARTLSGGQKRKLQLIMMLIGGSRVCCVDEVSGGLDPLSRRRVWDILLAERGRRTFILTTHFLDEAEYLADHMTIISRGRLKAEGSTSELKARLGNGYRFSVPPGTENLDEHDIAGLSGKLRAEETFSTTDTQAAMEKIKSYRAAGVKNYQIAGPTIEEVFMKLAVEEDANTELGEQVAHEHFLAPSPPSGADGHEKGSVLVDVKTAESTLLAGRRIGSVPQAWILIRKRLLILRWNWVGALACFLIPVIAAGMVTLLLKQFQNPGCAFLDQISLSDNFNLSSNLQTELVVGPPDALTPQRLELFSRSLPNSTQGVNASTLLSSVHLVDSLKGFNNFTDSNFTTIVPGGIYLGGPGEIPTFNYRSDIGTLGIYSAIYVQNAMDVLLTNQSIFTSFAVFDIPWPANTQDSLQFVFYFGLVMACYPAFFALYPTIERLRGIRALQYSNGVRSLPLWLAYLIFDGTIVLFISALITIIFAATTPNAWWNIGDLFVCLFLYGIASIHLSYTISLFAKSQLAAFAFSAGGQALMLVLYMSAYMTIVARSPPDQVMSQILLVHFTLGIITPIGQLTRAMIIGLNLFSVLCVGAPPVKSTHPADIKFYGGPIAYLIGQSLFLFTIFIWYDHKFAIKGLQRSHPQPDPEDTTTNEPEVSSEIARTTSSNSEDGLRVLHVSKAFKSISTGTVNALDNCTFGVKRGEVFALVGPNGAGKSTTISMLRGEVRPDSGSLYILSHPLSTALEDARSHLGVCPQHDALDQMTVLSHLRFYAGIRGVSNIESNVQNLVRAVGLEPFKDRMANKLSGGNKRKLSLAIALIGNPEVLLLDEPSSSMDPLAKRSMWKTLSRFVPHRSILLTTHSMEEADALADRVGVLAKKVLDIGTTGHLRTKYGFGFHVHLVLKSAPNSTPEEMQNIKTWIEERFPGLEVEREAWLGQLRFNIPSAPPSSTSPDDVTSDFPTNGEGGGPSVGSLFVLLEENKQNLGLEFYSVSVSTFDEVFLKVVRKHGVGEEDHVEVARWRKLIGYLKRLVLFLPFC